MPRPKKSSLKSPDAFFGSIADRILLTEILLAPRGERLSFECAQICAVLAMTDPRVQSPTEVEVEKFLSQYDNPRRMPEGWIRGYLGKSKPQLAIDVLRAFDGHYKQARATSIKLWILSAVVAAQFAALLMLGQVVLEQMMK